MPYDPVAMKTDLTRDEGRRSTVYHDSLGIMTVGIGHNLAISQSNFIVDALYACDLAGSEASLDLHWPWWRKLDPVRQRVMLNMMFNMGSAGLATFINTLRMIEVGQYQTASVAMLSSKWASQVGARATRLAAMMRTGANPPVMV